ncbi:MULTISPECIES: CopD family protein [Henriciella]|jgi:putative membrane protein|uniref:Protoporphyrinogen IX oxidase n=1 Tax=Henriciella pelagia TaxID=1977912 RepID=A0ABQ1JMM7_9PROT|nr:CopD family protein [Henriciella pelagia]GGB72111.1 membrane protein [Henriciella pelagia]
MLYLWIKALHLIFVVAFMAGMLVYPRYKLHQLSSSPGDELFETMKSASKKLKMIILNPSIILVWIFGVTMMVMNTALLQNGWFHVKLLAVLILTGLHGYFVMLGRKIDAGQDVSSKQLKMMNEVPFLLFIIAAVMVIVRPF